ncbi:heat shock protein Hsp90 family protein [Cavenderia fasciculata]|uniref:Heat shock protein Hsp90 family protein n=1 Tax=Cavenderia fasciculata TaxID=261658 RepID=F4PTJ0_CACFS|nr:heat shock protein Hsp90 family protein [Cavenderia fasciculata]EGG20872.1 heat shock protein Hsp90 family protein [Cavenderia fasciculata]|eukprot:XP_004358722.1 heat shock protein Hsp90 family protein [Cavenderia fasciculata]
MTSKSRLSLLMVMLVCLITMLAIPKGMANEGISAEDQSIIKSQGETHEFQAEVNKLMNIIINSLYSKKEIFLRELISNSADALDKIRFLALTNPALLGEGEQANLDIKIQVDKENHFLHITDKGIGMTKADLIKNLGTIAQSGTKEFIQKLTESADSKGSSNLIGQFGVGFYSLFLVADYVVVTSKNNEDDQYVWTSTSDSSFSIMKDPKGNTLGRGTRISLHIKDDSLEFLEQSTIEELVKKYSQFINFPIYLYSSKEVDAPEEEQVETPIEEQEDDEVKVGEEEEEEDEQEDEQEEEKPKEKKKITEWTWEKLNNNKPLWMRSPKEVEKEEYTEFYQALNKRTDSPLAYSHFVAEGDTEFRAMLFIPKDPPQNMFDPEAVLNGVKLFVRRVFITDNIRELLPAWLRFLQGVIDSDDLPLNVSREILQQHKLIGTIRKRVIKKFIQMVQEISNREDKAEYHDFFKKYGTALKFGIIEETGENKNRLIKLLQFASSKDDHTTFEDYVSRMKEGQDQIYYLGGKDKEQLAQSPLAEQALKQGYEVLYLVDPVDEYLFSQINKYGELQLTNLAREGVKFNKETNAEEADSEKAVTEEYKPLTDFLQKQLGKRVQKVVISKLLSDSPCILLSNTWGVTANMERIMKAQSNAGQQQEMAPFMKAKVMEINPTHSLIRALLARVNEFGNTDEAAKVQANVLYETAAISSGYTIENPTSFTNWIYKLMELSSDKLSETKYETPTKEDDVDFSEPTLPTTNEEEPVDPIYEEFVNNNQGGHDEL